ncbi:MAG: class III poly(R)-hydroxyalkanoic acid synthase subunit PhaC [Myxococcota bacterium]|nr:class III poly(R)-hydroxyalkanoic acid synthase subunit PhaC [Myxococcota bacterium]
MSYTDNLDRLSALFAERFSKRHEQLLAGMKTLTEPIDTSSGTTLKEEVLAIDRWKLYRYQPVVEKPLPIPVVIFYALVNRFYMIDLQPNRSMVRKFLEAGLDVYVVDWGHPTHGDRYLTMEDYIDGYMNLAVDMVRQRSGQNAITVYGICQGGTFSSIYTALYPEKVKNLALMVTPIDFDTDTGLLNVWSRYLDPDRMVQAFGNVPGDFMNSGFLLLNPLRLMFQKYVDFIERMSDKEFTANFIRMEKWIFDSPDQAGEAYRKFIKSMYQKNQLVKGEFELGGRKVDLKSIKQPVLNVFGEKDNLVPPACSRPFTDLVSSKDKTVLSFPTGHIGLFTSSRSQTEYAPAIASWLSKRCLDDRPMKRSALNPKAATAMKKKPQSRASKPSKPRTSSKKTKR